MYDPTHTPEGLSARRNATPPAIRQRCPLYRPARVSFLLALALFAAACSPTKKTGKTTAPGTETVQPSPGKPALPAKVQQVLQTLHANEADFSELQGRMKTKATWEGNTQSFQTQLRWKKGQQMWMSMTVIGIEGARVLMNRDSVKIADRLGQRYILKPIGYLKEKAFVDLRYSDIERIFLGQLFFTDTASLTLTETPEHYLLKADGPRFLSVITLDKSCRIRNVNITDRQYGQSIQADYGNYQPVGQKSFPMDRYLKIVSGTSIFELDAKFQSVDITKALSYPFDINPGYRIE